MIRAIGIILVIALVFTLCISPVLAAKKVGRDEDYPGGQFRRKIDHVEQRVLPGGRDNEWVRRAHYLEHQGRALYSEMKGDKERARAERERARSNRSPARRSRSP